MASKVQAIPAPERKLFASTSIGGKVKTVAEVPGIVGAFVNLASAGWLRVSNHVLKGSKNQLFQENVNLALVCALLFTTFLPLYYSEASRISDPQDGLYLDIELGYLSTSGRLALTGDTIHDVLSCSYLIAMYCMLFGTFSAVFFTLASNEAVDDEACVVFSQFLGIFISLPYFFFQTGILSYSMGVILELLITPRTLAGVICNVVLLAIAVACLITGFLLTAQGVYAGPVEEANNPPRVYNDDEINSRVAAYYTTIRTEGGCATFEDFMLAMKGDPTERGYIVPLEKTTERLTMRTLPRSVESVYRMFWPSRQWYIRSCQIVSLPVYALLCQLSTFQ